MSRSLKRTLSEPWIAIGLIHLVIGVVSAFFYTSAGGLIGKSAWWLIELEGAGVRLSSEVGFGWIFGFSAQSSFEGRPDWEHIFPPVEFEFEQPPDFRLLIEFPMWIPMAVCFMIGGIRIWIRRWKLAAGGM